VADDPTGTSTGYVKDVLDDLAAAVGALVAAPNVDLEVGEVPEAGDGSLESWPGPRALSRPDSQRALRLARSRLASDIRRHRAELVREFAAWWADLASVALDSAADGFPVPVVRAAAGDPSV
jgi:hypothetical protein